MHSFSLCLIIVLINIIKENLNIYFNFNNELVLIVCFFLIASIGVSHGALDNYKGVKFLKRFNIKNSVYFYTAYIAVSIFVIFLWIIFPVITLILFLTIAAFHFGKEDNVFKKSKMRYVGFFLFLKGALIILAPLYFNFYETVKIFEILNLKIGNIESYILLTLMGLSVLSSFAINKDFVFPFVDCFTIIMLNYTFSPLVAFTIYFCFLHSIRHSISLIDELDNKNFTNGTKIFFKKALPLTIITGLLFLVGLFTLNNYYSFNYSILKVIFIGLASLTFPHILLEYLLEKNEKKS
jgi:Brp/Blh family beta-carotene 15,15'-monooxygenase